MRDSSTALSDFVIVDSLPSPETTLPTGRSPSRRTGMSSELAYPATSDRVPAHHTAPFVQVHIASVDCTEHRDAW